MVISDYWNQLSNRNQSHPQLCDEPDNKFLDKNVLKNYNFVNYIIITSGILGPGDILFFFHQNDSA